MNNLALKGRFFSPGELYELIVNGASRSVISQMRQVTVGVLAQVFVPLDKTVDLWDIIPEEFEKP